VSLGSIKIAEKENGSIINVFDYGNYPNTGKTGALAPVHAALNLNPTYDFIGKVVIVEGITDYYFLKILQNKGKITNKVKIIPSSGAGNSSILISIAFGFSDDFILILDNDSAGENAKKKYIKEFGENLKEKIHFYSKKKLEKLMSQEVQEKLLEITGSNKVKKALGVIAFSENIDEFISSFDNETNNNIDSTLNIINKL